MLILGLSEPDNDAGAALLKDGELVGAANEDVLVPEVLEVAALDQELGTVGDLEIWILFVIALSCPRNHGTLDHRREAIREFIEDGFHYARVTCSIIVHGRGDCDVRHVDVGCHVAQTGSSHRIVDEQFVSLGEPVFDSTTDDTCSDDAYLHRVRRTDNWLSA